MPADAAAFITHAPHSINENKQTHKMVLCFFHRFGFFLLQKRGYAESSAVCFYFVITVIASLSIGLQPN